MSIDDKSLDIFLKKKFFIILNYLRYTNLFICIEKIFIG